MELVLTKLHAWLWDFVSWHKPSRYVRFKSGVGLELSGDEVVYIQFWECSFPDQSRVGGNNLRTDVSTGRSRQHASGAKSLAQAEII